MLRNDDARYGSGNLDLTMLEALRPRLVNYHRATFRDDAEDMVAEVLAKVALHIEVGGAATEAYVWQACRWAAIDWVRDLDRRHENSDAAVPDRGASHNLTAGIEASEALAQLGPLARAAFILAAEGYSERETAAEIGCNRSAIKEAKRIAREQLAQEPLSFDQKIQRAYRELARMERFYDLLKSMTQTG